MARWSLIENEKTLNISSFSLHPLIVQLLFSRGITTEKEIREFIAPNYETDLNSPFLFGDMEKLWGA
jgi:hypothetical protein